MPHSSGCLSIVNAIATIAKGLQLRLVVEGVEPQAQLDSMVNISCSEYQGFLFAQPLPLEKPQNCYEAITLRAHQNKRHRKPETPLTLRPSHIRSNRDHGCRRYSYMLNKQRHEQSF